MNKPGSLREYLQAGDRFVKAHPDRLQVRVEQGRVVAAYGAGLNFEWRYTLKLTLLDYAGDQAALFALVVAWLGRHQRQALLNRELAENLVTFEVDVLDADKVDLEISIQLAEAVRAEATEAGYDLVPVLEAVEELDLEAPSLLHEIYGNAELLVACQAHPHDP